MNYMNMTKIEQIEKPMPEVPEVQFLLQEMKDFINKKYARYLSEKEKDPYTGEDYYPTCSEYRRLFIRCRSNY